LSLTFVPTPIGNLRDLTLRALDALRDADLIVAEDTRVTRKLLAAYEIRGKPLVSYREENAGRMTATIVERAARERVVAVSDAGMPAIADPGRALLVAARAAGVAVEVLPGPTAFVAAAVLSGFPLDAFAFGGFLPRAAGARATVLRAALARATTWVFYEAPHRIVATLTALAGLAPAAHVFVARELTKHFEEQLLGTPAEVCARLARPPRGEFVLVIAPYVVGDKEPLPASDVDALIDAALAGGASIAQTAKTLAQRGVGVERVVPHVADDGEARRQHLDAVGRRLNRPQRGRLLHVGVVVDVVLGIGFVGEREMVVRLDQPRHDGHAREIDDLRAGGDRDVRSDVGDLVARDKDDLIGEDPAGFGIE